MKRLFYNIDNNKVYVFNSSHTEYFHNHKDTLNKGFDYYLRGLIANDTLYLRVFYPYNDIDNLTYNELIKKSLDLLTMFKNNVMLLLAQQGIKITDVKLNVDNVDLKNCLHLLNV